MPPKRKDSLPQILQARFEANPARHPKLTWAKVQARLDAHPKKMKALQAMEDSGGEPDVVEFDARTGEILFVDCAPETPAARRGLCYDRAALDARKEHKPKGDAVGMAAAMGVELLDEDGYRRLQALGEFDLKTSSWLATPPEMRDLGGALFGDRRFGRVFVYHNGAQSYYAARGFRAAVKV